MVLTKQKLYIFSYAAYCFLSVLDESLLPINSWLTSFLRLLLCGLAIVPLLLNSKIRKDALELILIIMPLCIWCGYRTGDYNYYCFPFFLAGAFISNSKNIIKSCMISSGVAYLLVTLLSIAGILPDYIYYHNLIFEAHTYGFNYYTWPQTFVVFVLIYYLILRGENIRLIEYIVVLALNYFAFSVYTTRLPFVICIVVVFTHIAFVKRKSFRMDSKYLVRFATILYPVVALILFMTCYLYDSTKIWCRILNEFLNNRIAYCHEGILKYGIKLFGSQMTMVGQYKVTYLGYNRSELFFIDSGFMYSLLECGIIYSAVIILSFALICRVVAKNNDKNLFVLCLATALYACVNDVLVKIYYNPLILLVLPIVFSSSTEVE